MTKKDSTIVDDVHGDSCMCSDCLALRLIPIRDIFDNDLKQPEWNVFDLEKACLSLSPQDAEYAMRLSDENFITFVNRKLNG